MARKPGSRPRQPHTSSTTTARKPEKPVPRPWPLRSPTIDGPTAPLTPPSDRLNRRSLGYISGPTNYSSTPGHSSGLALRVLVGRRRWLMVLRMTLDATELLCLSTSSSTSIQARTLGSSTKHPTGIKSTLDKTRPGCSGSREPSHTERNGQAQISHTG